MNLTLSALLVLISAATVPAGTVVFQSTDQQTSLLELYTSEGCSSCPPAEAWLSKLKTDSGLWRDFVPVAFHVDYWNYLGWRDAWSKEEYSDRQRDYAKVWNSANIYTPEFVLNGAEWHRWFWQQHVPIGKADHSGVLQASSEDGVLWQLSYMAPATTSAGVHVCELHTALLVCGVGSDVKAGENSGRHLDHDFAALTLTEQPLVSKTNEFKGSFRIDEKIKPAGGRLALAVWVTVNGQNIPVQAVGGWLP